VWECRVEGIEVWECGVEGEVRDRGVGVWGRGWVEVEVGVRGI
jgi:hypothetical protein